MIPVKKPNLPFNYQETLFIIGDDGFLENQVASTQSIIFGGIPKQVFDNKGLNDAMIINYFFADGSRLMDDVDTHDVSSCGLDSTNHIVFYF